MIDGIFGVFKVAMANGKLNLAICAKITNHQITYF